MQSFERSIIVCKAIREPFLHYAVGTSVDCTTSSTGTLTAAGLFAGNELGFAGLLCVATTRLPNLGVVWRVMNSVCTGNLAAARRRADDCKRISYLFVITMRLQRLLTILCYLFCNTASADFEDDLADWSSARPVFKGTFTFTHTSFIALNRSIEYQC